jgi:hypothetical protein
MKKFNDAVVYVRNGAELNALVVQSTMEIDPQSADKTPKECLLLAYLDPAAASKSIHSVNNTVATAFSVKPLAAGMTSGWKDNPVCDGSGSERYAAWTDDSDGTGYPDAKQAELDRTKTLLAQADDLVVGYKAEIEKLKASLSDANNDVEVKDDLIEELKVKNQLLESAKPNAADLDAVAAEEAAKAATGAQQDGQNQPAVEQGNS